MKMYVADGELPPTQLFRRNSVLSEPPVPVIQPNGKVKRRPYDTFRLGPHVVPWQGYTPPGGHKR